MNTRGVALALRERNYSDGEACLECGRLVKDVYTTECIYCGPSACKRRRVLTVPLSIEDRGDYIRNLK